VTEQPENEQPRDDEAGAAAEPAPEPPEPGVAAESGTDAPQGAESAGVAAESGTDLPDAPESIADLPETPDAPPAPPTADAEAPAQPSGGEPAAVEQPAQAGPAAEPPAATGVEPAEAGVASAPGAEEELEELAPRAKPEIPGADLIPDIVPEGQEFLDAEAQAAAEAEAEAAAAREAELPDDATALPIANAAIDLAAGARYTATGKRKTAVARVIVKPGTGVYSINGKSLEQFFPRETLQRVIRQPLETVGYESRMDVVARMHGGGVAAQAGALRHGISRALIVADPNLRGELKRRGFLTRDPRVKERKKAGLKKARKRPQFSKR
jgi:small subunit ribosomal protein S9